MPITQAFFRRSNALLLAAGLAVLVTIVATSLWLTGQSERNFAEVVSSREARSGASDLMAALRDAETGQRGYLLTRDESYLGPYNLATEAYPRRADRLMRAASQRPDIAEKAGELVAEGRSKLAELARTVAMARSGDFDGALAAVRTGEGKLMMDDLRSDYLFVLQRAEAALTEAIGAQEAAGRRLHWVSLVGSGLILLLAGAAIWTIMSYTRDLTRARREVETLNTGLEERVRDRTQALLRANAEIQRFAYIVTHDLRAPLVNIMGFTSELEATFKPVRAYLESGPERGPALEREAREALDTEVPEAIGFIRSSTRKMDGLINAILKISREGSRRLKPERVDLAAVANAAAEAVHHQASAEGGGIEVDARAGSIVSDKLSLDQILGNLLDNAIKYRSPQRPVAIAIRTRRERTGWVTIEVEDNGRGIAAADYERVFELFRRAGIQNTAGEGIGLAHVRTLVRNLGGDITVRSEPDVGSTFSVMLPPDLEAVQRSAQS